MSGERVVAALGGQDAGALGRAGVDHRTGADAGVPGPLEGQSQLLVTAERGRHGVVDDGGRDVAGDQAADGQPGGRGRTGGRGQDQPRDYVSRLAERGQYLVQGLGEQGGLRRRDLLQPGPVAPVGLRLDPDRVAVPAGQPGRVQGIGHRRGQVVQAPAARRRGHPKGGPPHHDGADQHDGSHHHGRGHRGARRDQQDDGGERERQGYGGPAAPAGRPDQRAAALAGRPSGRRVATVTVATGSSANGVPMAQRSRAPSRSPARRSMVAFSASNCASGGGA